jgi:hypothetical protein
MLHPAAVRAEDFMSPVPDHHRPESVGSELAGSEPVDSIAAH